MLHRSAGATVLGALCSVVLAAVFAGCSSSPPSPGASDETVGESAQAIQDGTVDNNGHPYAVGICIGGQKGRCNGVCSGTLILPNVVVTARHCVQETSETINCATDNFGANTDVNWVTTSPLLFQTTTGWHPVKNIYVPTPTKVCGNDIALIVLDDLVPPSEATPVTPGVQYDMGDLDRYKHSYTAVGYGKISTAQPSNQCYQSGLPASSYASCPGLRRYRENIPVACIPNDAFIDCPDTGGQVTDKDFVAGAGTCQGDSGSGAFETLSMNAGKPVSLGVLSRGGADESDPSKCGLAIYTRLDAWRDLVVQTAETASKNWTLYPKPVPDWTVYVPPPSKDGGSDAPAPTAPTNVAFGASCKTDKECASGICADTGAGFVCTTACDEATPCDTGYACMGGYCGVDTTPAAPAGTTTVTKSGCSTSGAPLPGSSSGTPGGVAGLVAFVALALNRRRGLRDRRNA